VTNSPAGCAKGDNWKLQCKNGASDWLREATVELVHEETGKMLSATSNHAYRAPIPGQLEVSGVGKSSSNTEWAAKEGVYFSAVI
jgi:hypothetical protein